jgi:hypothetical protein
MAKFVSYRVGLGERAAIKYINLDFVQEAQYVAPHNEDQAVLTLTLTDGTLQTLRGAEAEQAHKLIEVV